MSVGTQRLDFAEFYRKSKDDCLRTVLISVGDQDTAQELVAEAFARACASWRTVSRHPAPAAWVVRTALNANISRWRRRHREVSVPDPRVVTDLPAGQGPPDSLIEPRRHDRYHHQSLAQRPAGEGAMPALWDCSLGRPARLQLAAGMYHQPAGALCTDESNTGARCVCLGIHIAGRLTMEPAMHHSSISAVWADALFVSALQRGDPPGAGPVRRAVATAVGAFGAGGCAERVAQEFGDHPETAVTRMRWARQLAAEAISGQEPEAARTWPPAQPPAPLAGCAA
jgi:Sigma-70 region 2